MPTRKSRQMVNLTPANLARVQARMKAEGTTSFGAFINRLLVKHVPGFEHETEWGGERYTRAKGTSE